MLDVKNKMFKCIEEENMKGIVKVIKLVVLVMIILVGVSVVLVDEIMFLCY